MMRLTLKYLVILLVVERSVFIVCKMNGDIFSALFHKVAGISGVDS